MTINTSLFVNSLGRIQKPPRMTAAQAACYDEIMSLPGLPAVWSFKDRIQYIVSGVPVIPVCTVCGSDVHYQQHLGGFPKYCSRACASRSSAAADARKQFRADNPDNNISSNNMRVHGRNAMQIDHIKAKSVAARTKHASVLTKEWFQTNYQQTSLSQADLSRMFDVPQPVISNYMRLHDIDAKKYSSHQSSQEAKLVDALQARGLRVETHVRDIIKPYEIDIYLPDHQIGVEVNGIYWHSCAFKSSDYHYRKLQLSNRVGIQLLQFWDFEIDTKLDLVVSMILYRCGKSCEIIGARKLIVSQISSQQAKVFFDSNHLKGHTAASEYIALISPESDIIGCMSLSKTRFSNDGSYEIIRFAIKQGVSSPGAMSKLLKASNKTSVVSYVDAMTGDGHSYSKCGFTLSHTSPPCAWYFHSNSTRLYHRTHVQKHKLPALLDNFDASKTANDNLLHNGWLWVHDAGNFVYKYNRELL